MGSAAVVGSAAQVVGVAAVVSGQVAEVVVEADAEVDVAGAVEGTGGNVDTGALRCTHHRSNILVGCRTGPERALALAAVERYFPAWSIL